MLLAPRVAPKTPWFRYRRLRRVRGLRGAVPTGYDIHSSPWLSHGPNRNRWFTDSLPKLKTVDLSMAMLVITRGYLLGGNSSCS